MIENARKGKTFSIVLQPFYFMYLLLFVEVPIMESQMQKSNKKKRRLLWTIKISKMSCNKFGYL